MEEGNPPPSDTVPSNDAAAPSEPRPWDFSKRRVIVQGVMKFSKQTEMQTLVNEWMTQYNKERNDNNEPIGFDKIRKPPNQTWMTITLKDERMVDPFVEFINKSNFQSKRGDRLFAKPDRSGSHKRPGSDNDHPSKRQRKHRDGEQVQTARRPVSEEELKDRVTPLWKQTPEEQSDCKLKLMIRKCAMALTKELKKSFGKLNREKNRKKVQPYPWMMRQRGIFIEPMLTAPSPVRNKCEVTFGYRYLEASEDDQEPPKVSAVGFMVTGWSGGVSFSDNLPHIAPEASAIVQLVNGFLPDSPLPPYDPKTHTGFWRVLTIRTSRRTKENMVIVQHTPVTGGQGDQNVDYSQPFDTEKARLIDLLTKADLCQLPDGSHAKVTSIFFQEFDGLSNPPPEHPVQHAFGKQYLTERLGKCQFQISPGAFFQVNTEGAELLYQLGVKKIKEVVKDPAKALLFDVCCGTGTIGLTCMKEGVVGQVVGVDISEPAIRDAKQNAILNGFDPSSASETPGKSAASPTRFVAARAEKVLGTEIYKAEKRQDGKQFIALVDPARDGLHNDVIRAIRLNERIERLVYVSCNPTGSLVRDATMLCGPPTKRLKGLPFKVVSATPADIFPLTDHCEMVMVFDRMKEEELTETPKEEPKATEAKEPTPSVKEEAEQDVPTDSPKEEAVKQES